MNQALAIKGVRRADAQRNYERLLVVTRNAVAEHGGDIVLEEIAREAGVGIGTLYRHFPTRQDLLEAAFLDEALELYSRAQGLANDPNPFQALISWLRLQLDFGAHGRSMGAAIMNAKHVEGSAIQQACLSMREAGTVLLQRAQNSGAVKATVGLGDVVRLMHAIVIANEIAPDPAQLERMFDVVIAGIQA